ncbi:hypothetical protein [Collimonas sp. OK607]|uniref:hypothetical protein n=1 Tax=Collimonas sp. OK607 TaxID=1798194 RepID=UPI000B897E71|nr:hypothetical protein [Collimonas sp. OK607]
MAHVEQFITQLKYGKKNDENLSPQKIVIGNGGVYHHCRGRKRSIAQSPVAIYGVVDVGLLMLKILVSTVWHL